MNLEFNTAIHILCFLARHSDEQFTSNELAEKVCVNPVQLRRVTSKLKEAGHLDASRGKYGGYYANSETLTTALSDLFVLFVEGKTKGRLFTGDEKSDCLISREISHVLADYELQEYEMLKQHYHNVKIADVLNQILMEAYDEKI
ncbi:redox-sensitive transcriptional regulator HypR [Macrococcus carouselicus]|uniref:Transcriptional regulator n=1 Tax=Macrococcus carouselicus TaxID=69969 RepID=A0A9Q8CKT5_9STAP|nr:redox-sensitive transcriptional regulator HypR [Macrococcus carouselicus]TDM02427.1 transcriptional regulator [Macrococcus carouselicus]